MSEQHPIQNLMTETMEKIKSMVDVNTIIGTPIHTAGGTTIIPVSKVTFGFGAGGSDFQSRSAKESAPLCFGGGGGAGVTVSPVCFLVVPVSKVTFGFGAGGSDFQSRSAKESAPLCFGGGGGAGVTVSPVCFLVVSSDGDARILPLNAQAETTADRLVEMIPGAVNKVSSFMENRRMAKNESTEPVSSDTPEI